MEYLLFFGTPPFVALIAYAALMPFRRRFHSNGTKGKLVIEPGDIAVRILMLGGAGVFLWFWAEAFL